MVPAFPTTTHAVKGRAFRELDREPARAALIALIAPAKCGAPGRLGVWDSRDRPCPHAPPTSATLSSPPHTACWNVSRCETHRFGPRRGEGARPSGESCSLCLHKPVSERDRARTQRFATEAPSTTPAPKKRHPIRKFVLYSAGVATTFYVGSAFVAFSVPQYHDFFIESVPLGASFLQYAEDNDWDQLSVQKIIEASSKGVTYVQSLLNSEQAGKAVEKTKDAFERTKEASKDRIHTVTQTVKTTVSKTTEDVSNIAKKDLAAAKHQANEFSEGVQELVQRAEDALAGKLPVPKPDVPTDPAQPELVPEEVGTAPEASTSLADKNGKNVYDAPLPIGFEPPPGYAKPAPPKPAPKTAAPSPVKVDVIPPPPAADPLPLVAPAVQEFAASEPIIAQLATVIDDLASSLNSNPTAAEKARDVLDTAKIDLTQLASRIEQVKEEERRTLEAKLDEQTREYTIKLLEMEMEAQDKLDSQEEGFRKFFEEEKAKFVQAYREKLNKELQTQSEIINERYVTMHKSLLMY